MAKTKQISVAEIEYVAHRVAQKSMQWDEPIPDFGTRFPNILESCLKQPFVTFDKKGLYKGLTGKAAILFYLMVKNHPFENGNKRVAIATLLYLLYKNYKWLELSNDILYTFAVDIAKSNPKTKEKKVVQIERFIRSHLVSR